MHTQQSSIYFILGMQPVWYPNITKPKPQFCDLIKMQQYIFIFKNKNAQHWQYYCANIVNEFVTGISLILCFTIAALLRYIRKRFPWFISFGRSPFNHQRNILFQSHILLLPFQFLFIKNQRCIFGSIIMSQSIWYMLQQMLL